MRIVAVVLLTLFFLGKSFVFGQETNEDVISVFPPPPDSTRIIYVTKISSSFDIENKQSWFSKFMFGAEPAKTFSKPYGINIHRGKLYVCDTGKGLAILDLENKIFNYFRPAGAGLLSKPVNSFVDDKGYLYVADVVSGTVKVFDSKKNYVGAIGDKEKNKPIDIAVYDGKVWVTDGMTNEVELYDRNPPFTRIGSFPGYSSEDEGNLFSGTSIEIQSDTVYVSDMGDWSVKVYMPNGTFVRKIGKPGKALGQFMRPKGVSVDSNGIVHVIDADLSIAQMFNPNGQLLMFYGGYYQGPGCMYLPASIVIDYEHISYFSEFIDPRYRVKYLIFVTNQYGPDDITVYASVEPTIPLESPENEKKKKSKKKSRKRKERKEQIKF